MKQKKVIQTKQMIPNFIYNFIFAVTVIRLMWNFLFGFRWPSEYVLCCTVFTYDFGYIPRAFLLSILKPMFGYHVYSMKLLYVLIIGTALITLGCFAYFSYYFTIKTRNLIGSLLVLWYSLSIYSAYFSHEMGYFEQYGFALICFAIICSFKFKNNFSYAIIYAVMMFASLLISETNAFIVCPVFIAMTGYRIYLDAERVLRNHSRLDEKEKRGICKEIVKAVGVNIPNLLYVIWVGIYTVPEERITKVKELVRSHTHLYDGRLDEVGNNYVIGRMHLNTYVSDVNFKVWSWQVMCYLLLVIFVISVVLIAAGYWHRAIFYSASSFFMMFCAYVVNFLGWDQERFKFCAAMMITFFGIWMLKELGSNQIHLTKDILYLCVIVTMVMVMIMDYRLGLFDGNVYNDSLRQLKDTLVSTWRLNY